ncbi:MAG: pentapeptide repeat-containing protein [Cyanobacteria bacterium P01_B01_bin.77]
MRTNKNHRKDYRGEKFSDQINLDLMQSKLLEGNIPEEEFERQLFEEEIDRKLNKKYVNADLRGASFKGRRIYGYDFSGALLHGTDFSKTELVGVKFDNIHTGLTKKSVFLLRAICFPIVIMAGTVCGYVSGFLCDILIIDLNTFEQDFKEAFPDYEINFAQITLRELPELVDKYPFGVFIFVLDFCLGILIALYFFYVLSTTLKEGVRAKTAVLGVIFVSISVLITAASSNPIATTSVFGLASFIGGLSGIFSKSQASFINRILNSYQETDLEAKRDSLATRKKNKALRGFLKMLRGLPILIFEFYFALLGANSGEKHELVALSLAIGLLIAGAVFARRACHENQDIRSNHHVIRALVDHVISNLQTNFSHASFSKVTFKGAKIKHANFLNFHPNFKFIGKDANQMFEGSDKEVENVSVLVDRGLEIGGSISFNASGNIYLIQSQVANKIEQDYQNSSDKPDD